MGQVRILPGGRVLRYTVAERVVHWIAALAYIYALLTGYAEPPAGFTVAQGMHYNKAFPGHQIAMPPPLSDGLIKYTDGTKGSLDNYARDVSAFLMWAAEPKLEQRHKTGARVLIFLAVFAAIMYLAKRTVWAKLHRHDDAPHTA